VTDRTSLRAEHDVMLRALSARRSIFHFAHAAVSLFVAAVVGGAAFKLSIDLEYAWAPSLVLPSVVVSGVAVSYGVVRLILGARHLREESVAFDRLKALRRELSLDELPSAS